jgi:hypothetical protein
LLVVTSKITSTRPSLMSYNILCVHYRIFPFLFWLCSYPSRCTSGAGVPTRGISYWGHPPRVER